MSELGSRARIITFYSYKGGTGRSMALANVAWILAAQGKRVLVIDWDLEAPGLQRYFHPFLEDKELTYSDGVIDFVMRYAREAAKPPTDEQDWYLPLANLRRYACSLRYPFPKPGTVDLVPAGRQGPDYATRVNSFNWQHFYERLDGGAFLEAAKRSLNEYDFVLVDSRTGVSDTSGICTVQMPDTLVICFTPNTQSIEGAAAVAESAVAQRRRANQRPGLMIYPLMTRVTQGEKGRVQLARLEARKRFDPLLWQIPEAHRELYWAQMSVAHIDFYGFEEVLSVFADEPNLTNTMLGSMEVVAGYLLRTRDEAEMLGNDSNLPLPLKMPPMVAIERKRSLEQFVRQPHVPAQVTDQPLPVALPRSGPKPPASIENVDRPNVRYWFYLSYARQDDDSSVSELFQQLKAALELRTGMQNVGFMDNLLLQASNWEHTIAPIIASTRTFIALISPSYLASSHCAKEFQLFMKRSVVSNNGFSGILPISWLPLRNQTMPFVLNSIQFFHDSNRESGMRQLFSLRRKGKDARVVIEGLAEAVLDLAERANLPILEPADFSITTPNPFLSADLTKPRLQRATINFVYLAATRAEAEATGLPFTLYGDTSAGWRPFDRRIKDFAEDAIVSQNLSYQELPADNALADRIREANRIGQGTVVVVDNAALSIGRLGDAYQKVISLNLKSCWFIFIVQDPSGASLRVTPPLKGGTSVSSEQELGEWLQRVIDETRLRLISESSQPEGGEGSLRAL